jgi:hypothetical protein
VNAAQQAAAAFTDAWRDRTGGAAAVHRRMRLFRLDRLVPPAPAPAGAARLSAAADRDLLAAWFGAFAREVVLYTDLANPTSNALYERLGYAPVAARVVLTFEPAATLHP